MGNDNENLGVISLAEALDKAREAGLDLIEISPTANPPVARIMDFGKYLYQQQKKQKEAAKKAHEVEIKGIQIGLGTSLHDLEMRAKKIDEFLKEGNRVKIDLILRGREKYLDKNFIGERMTRILNLISEKYKMADGPKKSPRGMTATIEVSK
ncbi:MAG: translation initiation factor IF-3 [Candidatus Pacebacteria bacterium]|nr:translation initiation factor IF-3 [Candidatus Paceibacterota bacterium]